MKNRRTKKAPTVPLSHFLAEPAKTAKPSKDIVLPTAPRANRLLDEDVGVPHTPPFVAFINNLPFDADEKEVRSLFPNVKIESLRLPREDRSSKRTRGFAYLEFGTREHLIKVIHMEEPLLRGRRVRIEVSNDHNGFYVRPNTKDAGDFGAVTRGGVRAVKQSSGIAATAKAATAKAATTTAAAAAATGNRSSRTSSAASAASARKRNHNSGGDGGGDSLTEIRSPTTTARTVVGSFLNKNFEQEFPMLDGTQCNNEMITTAALYNLYGGFDSPRSQEYKEHLMEAQTAEADEQHVYPTQNNYDSKETSSPTTNQSQFNHEKLAEQRFRELAEFENRSNGFGEMKPPQTYFFRRT